MHICKATITSPSANTSNGLIVKVPVVLQEVTIEIPMHAKITFPKGETVFEIKKIKKHVKLTQCRLIHREGALSGQLFISGFVRKNIQYAANPKSEYNAVLSSIKSLTVEVPFECVAEIECFLTPPVGPMSNSREEFGFYDEKKLGMGFPEKDKMLGNDLSQFQQTSTEYFNEVPFCELIKANIIELDEALNVHKKKENPPCDQEEELIIEIPLENYITCDDKESCECEKCTKRRKEHKSHSLDKQTFKELSDILTKEIQSYEKDKMVKHDSKKSKNNPEIFTELSEKMVLDLTVKILQKQQISFGS